MQRDSQIFSSISILRAIIISILKIELTDSVAEISDALDGVIRARDEATSKRQGMAQDSLC